MKSAENSLQYNVLEVYTTVDECILKFTILCLIENAFKITPVMHFVTYVTRHSTIFLQKMKTLAKSFELL